MYTTHVWWEYLIEQKLWNKHNLKNWLIRGLAQCFTAGKQSRVEEGTKPVTSWKYALWNQGVNPINNYLWYCSEKWPCGPKIIFAVDCPFRRDAHKMVDSTPKPLWQQALRLTAVQCGIHSYAFLWSKAVNGTRILVKGCWYPTGLKYGLYCLTDACTDNTHCYVYYPFLI